MAVTEIGIDGATVKSTNPLPVTVTTSGASDLGKAEDAAHASGDVGVAVLAVRRDTPAVGSGTDGDYSTFNVDANGRVYVNAGGSAAASIGKAEDAAHTTADVGVATLAVRRDAAAVGSDTDGDYSTINVDALGRVYTNASGKPLDYGSLGHYAIAESTGAIAAGAAADSPIFYARNTSATNLAIIQEIEIDGMYATTAFAAGGIALEAFIARSFTAENGTPGGTALTITGNEANLRTSMGAISLGVIRIASTAALGAPTWTLDTQPIGRIHTHSSGGVGSATPIIGSIFLPKTTLFKADPFEHPIILAQNEGVAILATVPGTGVWLAGVRMKWAEVTTY